MGFTQTFPNGQVLTSSALTDTQMTDLIQHVTCLCLGLSNQLPFDVSLVNGTTNVTVEDANGLSVGYVVTDIPPSYIGAGGGVIPDGTTIIAIAGEVITLSAAPTETIDTTIYISNPASGRQVRQAWPTNGAPAWQKGDNVVFVRATEEDDWYNKVPDYAAVPNNDVSATLLKEYSRVWRVFFECRGPSSYTSATILKSALTLDYIHDTLAPFNVYIRPDIGNPQRAPELEDAQWWNRSDLEVVFYEQVNESIVLPTVASIELIGYTKDGQQFDLEAE